MTIRKLADGHRYVVYELFNSQFGFGKRHNICALCFVKIKKHTAANIKNINKAILLTYILYGFVNFSWIGLNSATCFS